MVAVAQSDGSGKAPQAGSTQGSRKRTSTPGAAPGRNLAQGRAADGSAAASPATNGKSPSPKPAESSSVGQLAMCFLGLQISFLTWGYMQEKVMTKQYGAGSAASKFPSSAFCVFSNRVLALAMAATIMLFRKGRISISAPLTAFAPCSLSNSISSFAQYEALRHVTFPLQTLSKSTKVVLVLLMGKVLNNKTNPWSEYIEALIIGIGVSMFAFSSGKAASALGQTAITTADGNLVMGLSMLAIYLASDSFTSQYQSRVYKAHKEVDQIQMMLSTNFWSITMTLGALLASGELPIVFAFLAEHPDALFDMFCIAVTSATGQYVIFHTIKTQGPVVFTIMMTTRQVFSMVISAIAFKHDLSAQAWVGAALVFGTAFYRIKPKAKIPAKK